jgi:hypothetical protein
MTKKKRRYDRTSVTHGERQFTNLVIGPERPAAQAESKS